jgi:hypothetical protein
LPPELVVLVVLASRRELEVHTIVFLARDDRTQEGVRDHSENERTSVRDVFILFHGRFDTEESRLVRGGYYCMAPCWTLSSCRIVDPTMRCISGFELFQLESDSASNLDRSSFPWNICPRNMIGNHCRMRKQALDVATHEQR